ncbi:MAG: TetR family transcriptional regulator [Candidatus Hydrogenedentota bacterium]
MSPVSITRERILDAAEMIVQEAGAARLTLDAVARRAHLSKGGLLYHFASKDALLEGMIERLVRHFETARQGENAEYTDGPLGELQSRLKVWLRRDPRVERISTALIAGSFHNPRLVSSAREALRNMITSTSATGLSLEFSMIVCLAVEGLWIMDALGVSPYDDASRLAIRDELLRLAQHAFDSSGTSPSAALAQQVDCS